jgi:cyclic pyranopterin monophosphate synthase
MTTKKHPIDLTHLTRDGHAHMVDVGAKDVTARRALARARVRMSHDTFLRLAAGDTPKGDVLAAARIAGIQAAKRTSELIPLCHMVNLTRVEVTITLRGGMAIVDASAEARDRTGVEMEAMVAASTAALTLYDMLKAVDRGMSFDVSLVEKTGGKSGPWTRPDEEEPAKAEAP